jgi:hypothetical protein
MFIFIPLLTTLLSYDIDVAVDRNILSNGIFHGISTIFSVGRAPAHFQKPNVRFLLLNGCGFGTSPLSP